ncbi:MAG: hypothetical protein C0482_29575, partial [Gordonia sp.]|nr:hypothetical protein [Gordonia sp. (in: high G+C Gram-positive bacteria)]
AVELDETVGTDRAAPGEVADGNTDDAGPGLGQKITSIAGGLANLFTVGGDFGSDGPGNLSDGELSFLGFGGGDLATNPGSNGRRRDRAAFGQPNADPGQGR